MKKLLKISSLKYLAAFLLPLIFIMVINQGLDNDSWDVLAEGRYIVNNGLYYNDVLSMHEGLSITVQNYGYAVIFYWIYSIFGPAGLYIGMLLLNVAMCFLIYKICMLLSKKNVNLSLLIMVVTDLALAMFGFATTRAQMVSYVIFLALIYILELYVKTDKRKYLWWIPVLSLVQVNLHASLWPMIFLVGLTYVVDSFVSSKFLHKKGCKIGPLLIVGAVAFLMGLANPYGVNMILLMLTSYGDPTLMKLVIELQPFDLRSVSNVLLYIFVALTLTLQIFGKSSRVKVRYLLMFFGFLALGLNSVKGMSQFILVMFLPLAYMYNDVRIEKIIDAKIGRDALTLWSGVVIVCSFVAVAPVVALNISGEPDTAMVDMINIMDGDCVENEIEPKSLKVYTGYNDGGYVEFRGYKPYLDPRGEVFVKKNNKKEDILQEWVDFKDKKITVDNFLDKYEFDYLLVRGNDPLYELNDENYKLIYDNTEYKSRLYARS